jgi:hypothetical protein
VPGHATAALAELDRALADELSRLRASCAACLCYRAGDVGKPLAGYGAVRAVKASICCTKLHGSEIP